MFWESEWHVECFLRPGTRGSDEYRFTGAQRLSVDSRLVCEEIRVKSLIRRVAASAVKYIHSTKEQVFVCSLVETTSGNDREH